MIENENWIKFQQLFQAQRLFTIASWKGYDIIQFLFYRNEILNSSSLVKID